MANKHPNDYEKYKTEKLIHREAFEYYYSLGKDRTVPQVAEEFEKSPRTVYEWSRKFDWADRIVQRDIEVGRRLKEETIDTVVAEKARYRKIVKLAIAKFVESLQKGEVKTDSILDLERLIKLDLTLMGEATEIGESRNTQEVSMSEEDRKVVEKFAGALEMDVMSVDMDDDYIEEE